MLVDPFTLLHPEHLVHYVSYGWVIEAGGLKVCPEPSLTDTNFLF